MVFLAGGLEDIYVTTATIHSFAGLSAGGEGCIGCDLLRGLYGGQRLEQRKQQGYAMAARARYADLRERLRFDGD